MSDGRRMAVALIGALIVHAVVALFIGPPPPPEPRVIKKEDRVAKLKAIRQTVELPKPKPPEPKPPEPEVKPQPTPKPKKKRARRARRAKPKAPAPKPVTAPKVEPAPLVLENVNLTGGVAVQAGDRDVFGDPGVAATRRNVQGDDDSAEPAGMGAGGGTQPGRSRPPKTVAPKPKRTVKGRFPDDAPSIGRTIEVKLSLYVGADGRVKKVKVVRGAGAVFDRAARKQAKRITFEPGTIGGKPKAMWVPWTFAFSPE